MRCTVNLFRDNTDTFQPSLCHLDLVDCIASFKKLTDLLDCTPLQDGTLFPNTKITYTSDTSAPVQTGLVDARGFKNPDISTSTGVPDLKNLLSQQSYNHPTTSQYCDTYLRTLGSSDELVATPTLKDYLIDIHIYRLVLFHFIRTKYLQTINTKNYIMSQIKCYYVNYLRSLNHILILIK